MTVHNNSDKRLFLLDSYALIYRSYFAFIKNPRFNSKGLNTSAMLGFVNILEQLLRDQKPTHIAVVFDLNVPTFRHEMFEAYKANREAMPEDLQKSIPYIRKIIEAYNIPMLEKAGFEADDVFGSLAKKAETMGYTTFMMTPDKDYAQLVSENIFMYKPSKGGEAPEIWGIPEIQENFQVDEPWQVIDVLGLMGDTADNIPGCPGVGPKTAMKLISEFKSVDGLYQNIDSQKGKLKENLVEFEQQVRMSRKLAEIILDVPVDFDEDKIVMEEPNIQKLNEIYTELEFRQLIKKQEAKPQPTNDNLFQQGTLFGGPVSTPEEKPVEIKNLESITTVPHQYYLIETAEQRASLRAELSVQKEFCFDTETTGLDTMTAELVCMSFAFRSHEAYCVTLPANRQQATEIVHEFQLVFGDEKITKIGQNIKYDLSILKNYGLEIRGPLFDTMIAHYLVQPEMRHNLDYLCEQYLNFQKITTDTLIAGKGLFQKTMRDANLEQLRDYSCEDADLTLQLKYAVEKDLDKNGTRQLFDEVEMPLIYVLADMEISGVNLNTSELKIYAGVLSKQIVEIEREIIEMAGEEFNVSSPKQLGVILFEKLKIDPNAKMTKTKQYSTAEETLEKLADKHPIIAKILDYRGLKKLLSTYVEALPLLINPKTKKLHTNYNQAIAATGRLSSTNPNLQNIPIRTDAGRRIRGCFVVGEGFESLMTADYSQIEMRIMAHASADEGLIDAFTQGEDLHTTVAAQVFGVKPADVDAEMRRRIKAMSYGLAYGLSAYGLSSQLDISPPEAQRLMDTYFERFGGVRDYLDTVVTQARATGYTETMFGRRRYLPDLSSDNRQRREMAERMALNAPIQGTAADIVKRAMLALTDSLSASGLSSRMLLQVHDELVLEVAPGEAADVEVLVRVAMGGAAELQVPLDVSVGIGRSWEEAAH